jgi:galactose mutarotase-like enzyme
MTQNQITLSNDTLSLAVAPLGAEMQYLRTAANEDLLWHGDAAFWTGRSPVLFPIVGRAVDDIVAVGDHTSTMPQHGFARRNTFAVLEQTPTMCSHILNDTAESGEAFPFAFSLQITHRLDGATLHVTADVTNNDNRPMPFGIGFHPAFCWPLPHAEGAPHHVALANGGSPDMRALEDGLLRRTPIAGPFVDGQLVLAEKQFDEGALVFPNASDALIYGPKTGPSLAFTFDNLPDLALWRPSGAPFICVEPWHGTASYVGDSHQIADRPNSVALAPNDTAHFGFSVTVTP